MEDRHNGGARIARVNDEKNLIGKLGNSCGIGRVLHDVVDIEIRVERSS